MLNFDLPLSLFSLFLFFSFLFSVAVGEPTVLRETGNNSLKRREEAKTLFSHHPPSNAGFAYTKNSLKERPNHKKAALQRAEAAGSLAATGACWVCYPLDPTGTGRHGVWNPLSGRGPDRSPCGMLELIISAGHSQSWLPGLIPQG